MNIRQEFASHRLNDEGMQNAEMVARLFSALLTELEHVCGKDGREMAIVRTKLEEAAFFAKKAMAVRRENQVAPVTPETGKDVPPDAAPSRYPATERLSWPRP